MQVTINGIDKILPSSLSEITLQQRIDFQEQHGNTLDEMADSIRQITDEVDREIETGIFQVEKMYRSVSFFLEVPLDVLKETEFIDTIANIYFACADCLFQEEEGLGKKNEFTWQDEQWLLAAPTLKNGDKMTFGEMIDSKQMIQDMIGLSKNRWECLLPLCAIFLRKKDEDYQESFVYENSERLELMKKLPMDIALEVSFFLKNSQTIYIQRFRSFMNHELKVEEESIQKITSNTLDGLTS